jgi:hypothetical protein
MLCTSMIVILFAAAMTTASVKAFDGWEAVSNAPAPFSGSAPLAVLGNHIYALCGTNCQGFWRYDTGTDTWTVLAPLPEATNFTGGATLCATDEHVYATPGGYAPDFWRYDPQTNTWAKKTRRPGWYHLEWGTSMVWIGGDSITLHSRDVGLVQYRISTDSWHTVAGSPFSNSWTGSSLVWMGQDYLYLNQGWFGPGLARYSFATSQWTMLTASPRIIFGGMVWTGGSHIYARPDYDTDDFYHYSISEDSWQVAGKMPLSSYAPDFDLVFHSGCIYTAEGRNNAGFWRVCVTAPATIDIHPKKLNLKGWGKWITAYIELPNGYRVQDINVESVALTRINDDLLALPLYAIGPSEIGDHDGDGVPDLMVKFNRQALIPLLQVGKAELTVSAELISGPRFVGSDTISVR